MDKNHEWFAYAKVQLVIPCQDAPIQKIWCQEVVEALFSQVFIKLTTTQWQRDSNTWKEGNTLVRRRESEGHGFKSLCCQRNFFSLKLC